MSQKEIQLFYNEYIQSGELEQTNYTGHFDILYWSDLKKDLSACERLQRKPFYKIALLKGDAKYLNNEEELIISGYTIVFTDPLTRSSFNTEDENFEGIYCLCTESFLRGTAKINFRNWPVFQERKVFAHSLSNTDYKDLLAIFNQIKLEDNSDYPFKEQVIRGRIFDIIHYVQKRISTTKHILKYNEDSLDERFF